MNRPEKHALFSFSYGLLMLGTRSFSGLDARYNDLCTYISYVLIRCVVNISYVLASCVCVRCVYVVAITVYVGLYVDQ